MEGESGGREGEGEGEEGEGEGGGCIVFITMYKVNAYYVHVHMYSTFACKIIKVCLMSTEYTLVRARIYPFEHAKVFQLICFTVKNYRFNSLKRHGENTVHAQCVCVRTT